MQKDFWKQSILTIFFAIAPIILIGCGSGDSGDDDVSAGDDDSIPPDDDSNADDDDLADDDLVDDDLVDDDTADDDSDDDDSIDDDAGDDDSADDDAVDDDSADDDAIDDDSADDDSGDDDSADDDSADDDSGDDDTVLEPYVYSIKVDNMPMADVISALSIFAEKNLTMILNVRPPNLIGYDLAEVLAQAKKLGVPVKIWPLLNPADGSWGCEDDADLFIANVLATMDYIAGADQNVKTIVLNMELGHPKIDLFEQYFAEGDWAAIVELLLGDRDLELFAQNMAKFQGLVDQLHQMGYFVQIGTYPFFLDDFPDGDPDIQDICDVPIGDLTADLFSFAPYRTEFSDSFGFPLGAYLVYTYAKSARERYGSASEIAVGIVPTQTEVGYDSPDQLAADIAAAKAAGVHRITVYHLPGILAQNDPDLWFGAFDTPPAQPEQEFIIDLMRSVVGLADFILNFIP